jgi:hypothetical protein
MKSDAKIAVQCSINFDQGFGGHSMDPFRQVLAHPQKQGKEQWARAWEWTFLQKELPNVARSVGQKVKNSICAKFWHT